MNLDYANAFDPVLHQIGGKSIERGLRFARCRRNYRNRSAFCLVDEGSVDFGIIRRKAAADNYQRAGFGDQRASHQ